MTETEFLLLAETTFDLLETGIEALAQLHGLDLQADRSGNILEIELPSSEKWIVNVQTPMQEIWLASRRGGFHYRWDGEVWKDTRDNTELFNALSDLLTQELGRPLLLSRPPQQG